jgi:uncharacterized protein (TIGR02996 family)
VTLLVNEALEAIVAEDPYDSDAWSVLEDWLLEHDDPRAAILRAEDQDEARTRLLPLLLGEGHEELASTYLDWRGGYVVDAILLYGDCQRVFDLLARAPASTLLTSLAITASWPDLQRVAPEIELQPFARSLRQLQLSSDELGQLPASVLDGLPRVQTLLLERLRFAGATPAFSRLKTLSVVVHGAEVVDLLEHRLSQLEVLRLDFRKLDPSVRVPFAELAPLWNLASAPVLEHLIVYDEPVSVKELLGVLAHSPLTARLRTLKLGDRPCEPTALLGYGTAFHHLASLHLPDEPRRFHNQPF